MSEPIKRAAHTMPDMTPEWHAAMDDRVDALRDKMVGGVEAAYAAYDDGTEKVMAHALRRGDHIHLTRENGRSHGGTATVMMVWPGEATTSVTIWTGDITYRNNDTVTIDKRQP